jgi:hypothetical protein
MRRERYFFTSGCQFISSVIGAETPREDRARPGVAAAGKD